MKPRSNRYLGHFLVSLSFAHAVSAAPYYWDTTSGSWGAGANWSDNATSGGTTGAVPGALDSVFFNQSSVNGAEVITLDADRLIDGITFNNTGTTAIVPGTSGTITPGILTVGTGGITIASGAGAVTLNTATKLGGNQTWINNSTINPFTFSSTITNMGDLAPYVLTIDGAGATRLNGVISNGGATGTTALVKSGSGTLTIGSMTGVANTFSGGTTINANSGTVILSNAATAGLGSGAISIGSGSILQFNSSTRGTANNISNVFTGSGTLKFYSSPFATATGFTLGNNLSGFTGTIQVTNNGVNGSDGSKLNIGTGAFNASGASLQIDSGSQLFYTGGANTATFAAISVSGNGGNEGRGALRIENGTLAGPITLTGSSAWGQASLITGSITGTATTGNTQVLTLGTVNQSGGATLSGVISDGAGGGNLALTKRNTGTMVLTGTAVNTFTGGLNVNGGTLTVDYTAAGSPLTNLVNAGNAVSLGGGTLGVKGAASGTTSQSFTNGVNFASGTSGATVNRNGGTSTTLNLGTITRSVGGVANFTTTTAISATVSTTEMIKVTNGTSVANGALGAWALALGPTTNSVRYVAVDATGALKLVTANTTLGTNWASVNDASKVYTTNAGVSLSTNPTAQALQNPGSGTITVALNGQTLTTNGLLSIGSTGNWNFTRTGVGGITVGAENELVIAGASNVTISAPIANKTGGSFNSNLTYAGGGTLTLNTVASTYTGTTTVNSGTLTLGLANVLNSSSSLVTNGGTAGISTFDQSVAGVKVTGGGVITGTTGILTSASTYDIQRSGTISAILAGSVGLDKTTDFNATLSGANTFTGNVNIKAGQLAIATASNPTPLGNTANNVYLGDSSGIDFATLSFSNTINLANPITVQSGSSGTKMIMATSGTGTVSGNVTLNDDLYLWTNGGGLTLSGSSINLNSKALKLTQGTGTFTLSGTVTGAAGSIDIVGANTGTSIFSSTESTYGGGTVLGGANTTVQVDASSTGGITKGPFGTGTVTLNGAAVNAGITADQTIANAITIAENTTFATQATEKSLTFSGATTLANGDRTLTVNLGTTVSGKGVTFSNAIGDNGQGLGIIKAGTGLLTLSGSNTYRGQTAVAGGILAIASQNAVGNSTQITVGTANNSTSSLRIDVPNATSTTVGAGKTVLIRGNGASNLGALLGKDSTEVTWAGNVVLGDTTGARIGGGASGILTVDGVISEANSGSAVLFSRAAGSTTILNKVNTYTGDTQFFMGGSTVTIKMGIAGAIHSGSRVALSSPTTGTGYFDLNGYNQNVRAISDTFGGDLVVTNSSSSSDAELKLSTTDAQVFNGWIQDGVSKKTSLVVTGTGSQNLSGTNTYTGGTQINGGTLTLGHATDTLADAGAINVDGGELALGTNTDTVGAVTLTSGSITGTGAGKLTGTGSNFDVRSGSISAKLGGIVGLDKSTAGSVTISSDNSTGGYTGATNISAGTLALGSGASIGSSSIINISDGATLDVSAVSGFSINSLQTLSGSGTVKGNTTISGTLGIGNSPGTMTFDGDLGLNGISNFEFGSTSFNLGSYDLAQSGTGNVTFGGVLNLFFDSGEAYTTNSTVKIFDFGGSYSGNFSSVNFTGLGVGQSATFNTLNGIVTVVPEPGSAILGGLGMLLVLRRRRS